MGNILLSAGQEPNRFVSAAIIVLILLGVSILVRMVRSRTASDRRERDAGRQPQSVQPAVTMAAASASADEDEAEIVAAIAAAVAMIAAKEGTRLSVRSYRRIGTQAPAWNRAGRHDAIANRF